MDITSLAGCSLDRTIVPTTHKRTLTLRRCLLFSLLVVGLPSVANAAIYEYSDDLSTPDFSNGADNVAGYVDSVLLRYDESSSELHFELDVGRYPSQTGMANGFWLVVNNGGMPRGDYGLPIIYGDVANNRITAYTYYPASRGFSYKYSPFIESFVGALDSVKEENKISMSFTIDVSNINSFAGSGYDDWKGIKFDETIGVWMHPILLPQNGLAYNEEGRITTRLRSVYSASYDVGTRGTTVVPVPAAFWLFTTAMATLLGARKTLH